MGARLSGDPRIEALMVDEESEIPRDVLYGIVEIENSKSTRRLVING